MPTPFGPQLIGETEKTLNAILRRILLTTGLTEPQWVTLRLAGQLDGAVDQEGLAAAVAERAHFTEAADLVAALTQRGLLDSGRLTAAGGQLVESLQARIAEAAAPIWQDLAAEDVAATTRILNEVVARARGVLGDLQPAEA
jgi:hypothetical protein